MPGEGGEEVGDETEYGTVAVRAEETRGDGGAGNCTFRVDTLEGEAEVNLEAVLGMEVEVGSYAG